MGSKAPLVLAVAVVLGCSVVSSSYAALVLLKLAAQKKRTAATMVSMLGPVVAPKATSVQSVPTAQTVSSTGGGTTKPTVSKQTGGNSNATINDASVVNPSGAIAVAGPVTDKTKVYKVNATYYGPDKIHGIKGGNDNIFFNIPSGQYTAPQLRQIGKHFVAMSEQFLKKGFMGAIIRIKGSKSSFDAVVVDLLPDRMDGKNVQVDVHDMADWLALGGDEAVGIQPITIQVVGKASIPVSPYSAWTPSKFGF